MLRDSSFIDDVPEEHRKDFVDSDKVAPYKLKILKKMIQDRFPVCIAVHDGPENLRLFRLIISCKMK